MMAAVLATSATARAEVEFDGEVDLFELHLGEGDDHLVLDSTFTIGTDSSRFVAKFAGGSDTRTAFDDGEIQALYSRELSDSVAVLGGLRHDLREGPSLTHGALGFEAALAPWLESEHFFFVSQHGDLTGSGHLIASWDLSPRLTLEPRLVLGWSGQRIPAEALASGFTDVEVAVRLRRPLGENLDVYAGIIHERLLGGTRDIALASGDKSRVSLAVIGVGLSF